MTESVTVMRHRNDPRGSGTTEPSAPPLSLINNHLDGENLEPNQEWGPPPRYEEAVADDQQRLDLPSDPPNGPRQPSPISSPNDFTDGRPQAGLAQRTAGSLANVSNLHEDRSGLRLRSISPGEQCTQAGAQNASDDERMSDCDARERKKKRSPASKIKKGLENIAFFIIQILD